MIKLLCECKRLKAIWRFGEKEFAENNKIIDAKFAENNRGLIALMDVKLGNFGKKIEENLETKMLIWKSEIIDAVDKMADEIRTEREFRAITTHQISELQ